MPVLYLQSGLLYSCYSPFLPDTAGHHHRTHISCWGKMEMQNEIMATDPNMKVFGHKDQKLQTLRAFLVLAQVGEHIHLHKMCLVVIVMVVK